MGRSEASRVQFGFPGALKSLEGQKGRRSVLADLRVKVTHVLVVGCPGYSAILFQNPLGPGELELQSVHASLMPKVFHIQTL